MYLRQHFSHGLDPGTAPQREDRVVLIDQGKELVNKLVYALPVEGDFLDVDIEASRPA